MLINAHVTSGRFLDTHKRLLNRTGLRKTKIVYNFGFSECNSVNSCLPDVNVQCD